MFAVRQKILKLTIAAVVFFLGGYASPLVADEVIRIMAGNLSSGTGQDYDPGEGGRIFKGLQPDIALVQEFNYMTNSTTDLRAWVTANFGAGFSYFRQSGTGIQIPNGIVSRYPILASGIWDDTTMTNRDYSWAKIDIPGDKNLWAISVHISSGGGSSQRNEEAGEIKTYIQNNIPAGDYYVLGGDFNTTSRTEACITTLSSVVVTTGPWPADQANDGDTNAGRNNPYDWVMADAGLNARKTSLIIGGNTFPNGLVFDSRVTTPYSLLPTPVLLGDSGATGMQHMGVIRAFLIPTSNAAPTIASAATSSSTETVTDSDLSIRQIIRAASTGLSVTAADDGGEAALKYTWSLVSGPGSSVTFSVNGTNAAKSTTATFQAIGDYTFGVTAQDVPGLSVSSSVKIRVVQAAGSLALNPATASLAVNATQAFSASLLDQFSQPMVSQPASFTWSANGGGTLNSSGLFTATTAGGPFVVTASSGGFSRTSSVTVTRAAATISLANLSQTYDGSAKSVTATTSPASRAVSILYNGAAAVPVNAGSYAVTATITDPNYQGSSSGTLVIQKASATIQLTGLAPVYDGSSKTVTATTSPAGRTVSILYEGFATPPVNAGSYAVTASITDVNYQGSSSGMMAIQKAAATIVLTGLTATYDGTPDPVTATTTPAGRPVTILYEGAANPPVNAGNYAITASVRDANYEGSSSGTLVIQKADATIALTGLTTTYDGNPKLVAATTNPLGRTVTILYDGSLTPPTNAGSYAIIASITDANYQGSSTATLVIAADEWASWKNSYFTAQEQDAGLASDSADPDSDGLSNLAEYALGTNPREFTTPPSGLLDATGLSITFTRPANLPGIHYAAEASGDLQRWSPVSLELLTPGAVETVRARDPLGSDPAIPRFLRLRFERE